MLPYAHAIRTILMSFIVSRVRVANVYIFVVVAAMY